MLESEQVFFTNLRRLGDKYIYPFHLYLYHPVKKKCILFLEANCPLTPERRKFLSHFEKKGAKLAVKNDQKLTFDRYLKDIILSSFSVSENLWQLDEIIKEAKLEKKKLEERDQTLEHEFNNALVKDDFSKVIKRVQIEVLSLEVTHSALRLAKVLSLVCLDQDKPQARIIALNYLIIHHLRQISEADIVDSFLASCLCDLGELNLSRQIILAPYKELDEEGKKLYQQHPNLSLELLGKTQTDLPALTSQIIQDHHERWNGSGYPGKKALRSTHPLGLSLALSAHLVEFSKGHITTKKYKLRDVVEMYKKRDLECGLDLEFSFPIYQALLKVQEIKTMLSA